MSSAVLFRAACHVERFVVVKRAWLNVTAEDLIKSGMYFQWTDCANGKADPSPASGWQRPASAEFEGCRGRVPPSDHKGRPSLTSMSHEELCEFLFYHFGW